MSNSINKVSAADGFRSSTLNGTPALAALDGPNTAPGAPPSGRQWVAASMRLAADLSALEPLDEEPARGSPH